MIFRLRTVALLAALAAACGGSSSSTPDAAKAVDAAKVVDAAPPDAPPADAFIPQDAPAGNFACAGQPLPTTAPATVAIAGTAQSASAGGLSPAAGVTVKAFAVGTQAPLATTSTSGTGAYSLSVPTGGAALDGYLLGTKQGFRDSYVYPPAKIFQDLPDATVLMLMPSTFDLLLTIAGATQTAGHGAIGIAVVDCNGDPVPGATVTAQAVGGGPVGTIRYTSGQLPTPSATSTDASGLAFVFDVPVGEVTVNAVVAGTPLRGHVVRSYADANTTTVVRP